MKCTNCGNNNATTHIKQNINGQVSEAYLCPECAEKAGVGGMFSDFGGFGFGGFSPFGSLLGTLFGDAHTPRSLNPARRCQTCGCTFSDIAKNGKAGCPDCYDTFVNELNASIQRIHGITSHTGKQPKRGTSTEEKKDDKTAQLVLLKKQMSEAVEKQEYEQAAVLRDKIKELEASING